MEWPMNSKIGLWFDIHDRLEKLKLSVDLQIERYALWRPVFIAVGIAVYFETSTNFPLDFQFITLSVCLTILCFGWIRNWNLGLLYSLGTAFLIIFGYTAADFRTNYVSAPIISEDLSYNKVTGVISKIERFEGRKRIALEQVTIEGIEASRAPRKIRISYPDSHLSDNIEIGVEISTQATLRPPPLPSVPGLYNFARVAWFQQIGAVGYTTKPIELIKKINKNNITIFSNVKRNFNRFRDGVTVKLLADGVRTSQALSGLRAALITGDRTGISEQTYSMIRNSGLAHLLAISGLHMGLIAMLVFTGVRFVLALIPSISLHYNSKKIAAFAAICVAAFYMVLSGQTVPTERAFIMTAIVLSGVLFNRNVISLRTVSIAACIILIMRPEALLSASFQLSFAAVVCLVTAYENEYLKSLMIAMKQTLLLRVVGYISFLAITTLIATIATAPFSLYHFGQIATFGLIANLFAVPIMGVIVMPAAILSMILMPFGLEFIGFWCMDFGLAGILSIAHWVSSLDGAVLLYGGLDKVSIILISFMMVWFCLWRGVLRYLAPIFFIMIYASSFNQIEKQIFVDGEGSMIGYFDPALGAFNNSPNGQKFIKNLWLTSWGVQSFKPFSELTHSLSIEQNSPENVICEREGCKFQFGKASIFNVNSQEAAYEACGYGGIVIFPHGYIDRSSCTKSTIIDRKELKKLGGLVLTKSVDSPELNITSVHDENDKKPWYLAR